MIRKIIQISVILGGMLWIASANAKQDAESVVKQTVESIVSNIEKNRETYRADTTQLYKMIDEVLLPVVHAERISQLVLSKNWRKASEQQRQEFVLLFKTFLLRSYADALLEYSGEKVNYLPSDVKPDGDRVVVKAELVSHSGESYKIYLYMSNRNDTQWRAYNLEVEGINLVAQYRQTFAQIVSSKGIEGLLQDLREKNAKLKT